MNRELQKCKSNKCAHFNLFFPLLLQLFQSLILFYCLLSVHTPIHNGTFLAGVLFREASKTTSSTKIVRFENKWNRERCQLRIPGLCHSLIYCFPFLSGFKRRLPCQLFLSLIQNYLILDQVQNNGSKRIYRIKGQTASGHVFSQELFFSSGVENQMLL